MPNVYSILIFVLVSVFASGCKDDQGDKLNLTLKLNTDRYSEELSWSIFNSKHEIVRTGSGYESNAEYEIPMGVDPGGYRFEISDSGGDGVCCSYGNGSFELYLEGDLILDDSGTFGDFTDEIQHRFNTDNYSDDKYESPLNSYYQTADLLAGYELKSALHSILKNNYVTADFDDLWGFFSVNSLDTRYEKDSSILDRYSEKPATVDSYSFTAIDQQCGDSLAEGDCYEREHSVPSNWFDGDAPMNSDVHHIFPVDGAVKAARGELPYGEVDSRFVSFTSSNGSKVGAGHLELGYTQPVFEPIDEFKGDFARAYFYIATRYEDVIAKDDWHRNTKETTAALVEESSDQVYQSWLITMLLKWHESDPVSAEEISRNDAAEIFQGNRNPFIDHPDFAKYIWTHEGFEAAEYHVY